jgi:hypothetical protein
VHVGYGGARLTRSAHPQCAAPAVEKLHDPHMFTPHDDLTAAVASHSAGCVRWFSSNAGLLQRTAERANGHQQDPKRVSSYKILGEIGLMLMVCGRSGKFARSKDYQEILSAFDSAVGKIRLPTEDPSSSLRFLLGATLALEANELNSDRFREDSNRLLRQDLLHVLDQTPWSILSLTYWQVPAFELLIPRPLNFNAGASFDLDKFDNYTGNFGQILGQIEGETAFGMRRAEVGRVPRTLLYAGASRAISRNDIASGARALRCLNYVTPTGEDRSEVHHLFDAICARQESLGHFGTDANAPGDELRRAFECLWAIAEVGTTYRLFMDLTATFAATGGFQEAEWANAMR